MNQLIERLLHTFARVGPSTRPLILPPWEIERLELQGGLTCEAAKVTGEEGSEEVQRWTAKRRAAIVISLLKGETSVAQAARQHGLKVAEVEEWRDRFMLGAENALRAWPKDDEASREEEITGLEREVGEQTTDLGILLLD